MTGGNKLGNHDDDDDDDDGHHSSSGLKLGVFIGLIVDILRSG